MIRSQKIAMGFCAFMALGSARDASGLTLRDALTAAYKNNQDLLAARQQTIASHESIVQAKAGYRPSIQAQGSKGAAAVRAKTDAGGSSQNTTQQNSVGAIQINQNLFRGGADAATVAKTEFAIKAQWAQLKNTEQQIMQKVVQAYLDLYVGYANVEVYRANLISTRKAYEAARDKKLVGEETLTNESAAEAQYAQAQAQLEQAEAGLSIAKATFEQLTGLGAPERVEKLSEIPQVPSSFEELREEALRNNPAIEQARADYDSAKRDKKIYTGNLLPSVDLQASSSRNVVSPKTKTQGIVIVNQTNTTFENKASLNLTIPLYEQGSIRSKRRQATETIVAKRLVLESARQAIVQQCSQAYRSYLATKANLKYNDVQVKSQEVAVESTRQEMEVGTKVLTDLLIQQTNLLNARLSGIKNAQAYYQAVYQMLALLGKLTGQALGLPVDYFDPKEDYDRVKNRF